MGLEVCLLKMYEGTSDAIATNLIAKQRLKTC
jgi:hypothetical protein